MTAERIDYQGEVFANRVRRQYNHLRKRFARQNIDCFRLYDWDIPEVRAVVDWYAGHLVVGEYVRTQTGPQWLGQMAQAVAAALGVAAENTHVKKRQTNTKGTVRYRRMGSQKKRFIVRERDLKFWVNLDDFLDTGLFSDHRETRVLVRDMAKGENFLNLFAYTGAFTCAAALGGAKSTVTVDRSQTYMNWAQDNLKLNKLWGKAHALVQSDTDKFLIKAFKDKQKFSLAVIDPPSFFRNRANQVAFDINRDHPQLLKDVLKIMVKGAKIFFSTNHQRLEPQFNDLAVKDIKELTPQTIPIDYRNRKIHRCWMISV
ncbi:MAG: class I SAM-dependent methyltransferase [Candidatus Omnitrophica bacterium]|nr:class I SAM-dependent methyltransferase [Candidatus Omnitrophota bacterium]